MAMPNEVVIDGVIYVPVTTAIPGVDQVMEALYESYMGTGFGRWNEGHTTLWVTVNEDGEGMTLEEFAAEIAKSLAGSPLTRGDTQ